MFLLNQHEKSNINNCFNYHINRWYGLVIYTLYIKPLSEVKGLYKWYEYALAIIIITVINGLIFLALKGVFKLIDWAISNID